LQGAASHSTVFQLQKLLDGFADAELLFNIEAGTKNDATLSATATSAQKYPFDWLSEQLGELFEEQADLVKSITRLD